MEKQNTPIIPNKAPQFNKDTLASEANSLTNPEHAIQLSLPVDNKAQSHGALSFSSIIVPTENLNTNGSDKLCLL